MLVIGGTAEQPLGDLQVGGEHAGDLAHLGDYFGADAVAGQEEEVGHGRTFGQFVFPLIPAKAGIQVIGLGVGREITVCGG